MLTLDVNNFKSKESIVFDHVHYVPWGYPFNRTNISWGGGSPSQVMQHEETRLSEPRPGSNTQFYVTSPPTAVDSNNECASMPVPWI